ncbi:iron uptake system protein EfeO [Sinirhodobacter populi]|uniref:Iron uptake system protein EfeO n=2 Tax=Paenirhodobacter populi TaxID=2306993 RepID=A0A443K658_9RHOB|nr:iron uptake system protein EfeO [Sinirhodobacter populi]RWR28258.1 iron uptake system protein EfeO [Sinirhodobacter populi]
MVAFHLKTTALALAFAAGMATQGMAAEPTLDLVGPLSEYKLYVAENTAQLVTDTEAFVAAIKAGDVEKAKSLFAPTRMSYERIEPIAELFSDLDGAIDARADDYEKAEADEAFTGFHRIEYALWVESSTDPVQGYADQLLTDVQALDARINELTFPPEVVVGGAAALMEEVAATKISGEEDRYSRTDLWDFDANFAGSEKIYDLLKPLIAEKDPAFVTKTDANFKAVDDVLAKYRKDGGYVSYVELTDADRTVLSTRVNTLAEDLSTLRGMLGLN